MMRQQGAVQRLVQYSGQRCFNSSWHAGFYRHKLKLASSMCPPQQQLQLQGSLLRGPGDIRANSEKSSGVHLAIRRKFSSSSSLSSSSSRLTTELREFKDRLRPLGPGKVDLSRDDGNGLAALVLDNQDRRNALTGKMMVELADAVDTLETWERGVAVTLQGAGGNFCAGADLSLAREHVVTGMDGRLMCALMTDTLDRLRRLPLISVAVVDGAAIGGGAELSTCCDFRVAGPESVVRFVQVKMGVSTGWGGGARLVRIVGRREALRLLAWSPTITAAEGLTLGLLDAVSEAEGGAALKAGEFLAGVLERDAYGAVRAVKSVVAAADPVSKKVQLAEEDHFSGLWGGTHNRKALESSKRKKS